MTITGRGLLEAHRDKLMWAAVLLALVAAGTALKRWGRDGLVRAFYGRGHIAWVTPEWRAKQAAIDLRRPLARVIVDPRHAEAKRLEALARERRVELLLERFVWLREVSADASGPPAPPRVDVFTPEGERVLAGPWTIDAALGPDALADLIEAATPPGWDEGIPGAGRRP